jgi:hypothetical protein
MPGTSVRYGFRKGTFAGLRRYDEDAPIVLKKSVFE